MSNKLDIELPTIQRNHQEMSPESIAAAVDALLLEGKPASGALRLAIERDL